MAQRDETKGITIRLTPELWRSLRLYSLDSGESIQALTVRLLSSFIDSQPKQKK